MTKKNTIYRFLFAGGGTGGHLYPAIAVADQIKLLKPEADILFVGTSNKIESRVVPKKGFNFKTIWISGFARKLTFANILFPLKMIVAGIQSILISARFKPAVAIGTGAYVAGPAVWGASFMGAKVVLLEQNSYPGITNRMLEKKAEEIFISFNDSRKYFRDDKKLNLLGNPIRVDLEIVEREKSLEAFNLDSSKKTLVILGGSGGAKSINETVKTNMKKLIDTNIQIIWQTGQYYFNEYKNLANDNIKVLPFIENMSEVYSAADLVLCRAGATTIAEVALLGIPVIFVPSSNVAADHQYKNAKSIVDAKAAEMIRDNQLAEKFCMSVLELINDEEKLEELSEKIKKFSKPNAALDIAKNIIKLAEVRVL